MYKFHDPMGDQTHANEQTDVVFNIPTFSSAATIDNTQTPSISNTSHSPLLSGTGSRVISPRITTRSAHVANVISSAAQLPPNAIVWNYSSDTDDGTTYIDRSNRPHPCSYYSRYLHERHDNYLAKHPEVAQRHQMSSQPDHENRVYDPDWVPRTMKGARPPPPSAGITRQQYMQQQRRVQQQLVLLKQHKQRTQRMMEFEKDPLRALRALHLARSQLMCAPERQSERAERRRAAERRRWRYLYGRDAPLPERLLSGGDTANTPALADRPCVWCASAEGGSVCCVLVDNVPRPALHAWQGYISGAAAVLAGMVLTTIVASLMDTAFALPQLFYAALLLGVSVIITSAVALLGVCCRSLDVLHFSAAIHVLCAVLAALVSSVGAANMYHVRGNVAAHEFSLTPPPELLAACEHNVRVILGTLLGVAAALSLVAYLVFSKGHIWLSQYARFRDEDDGRKRVDPESAARARLQAELCELEDLVATTSRASGAGASMSAGGVCGAGTAGSTAGAQADDRAWQRVLQEA